MKQQYYPWWVLSVTSLGVLLATLNLSTLNVALPVVVTHFHAGAVASGWILLSYMLVNTTCILVFGKLADIYGRRRLYLFGFIVFTVVSCLCGLALNVWTLIVLRGMQAVGGALIITNTTPLITDAFPERKLGTALSLNILIASMAQLIGPVVGGYLAFSLGWRWVFWFNVPVGVFGTAWAMLTLRKVPGKAKGEQVDWSGSVLTFIGLSGLILSLSEGGILGWSSVPVIAGLMVFIVSTFLFIAAERVAKSPMIDFSLFRDRAYSMANLATFLNALARSSVVLLIALFYQLVNQENPFAAGLKVLPVTVGMMVGSLIVGALTARYGARLLSTSGLLGTCIGMSILMWKIGADAALWWVFLGEFLIGIGTGIFQTPNTKSIMLTVPVDRRGIANGLRSMLQNMGAVVSTALSLMIVTSALPLRLKDAIYAGASRRLDPTDTLFITQGYRITFAVLILLTVLAIVSSYLRSAPRHS